MVAEAGFELRNSFEASMRLQRNLIKPVAISSKYKSKPLKLICQFILANNNNKKSKGTTNHSSL